MEHTQTNGPLTGWRAKWIWAMGHASTPNFYMYARKEINAPRFREARVFVTCATEYKLFVNGRYVGRGPSPCHPSFHYYDSYDLGSFLRPGKNVIAALCYNYGVETHCRPPQPGAFLLQAEIDSLDGEPIVIATDETWRVMPACDWDWSSTRMFFTVGFQEVYDSRLKPVGWNVVGYDDAQWREPEVVGEVGVSPWTSLVPRDIPPLRESSVYPERVVKCGWVSRSGDDGLDVATRMFVEQTETDESAVMGAESVLEPYNDIAEIAPGRDSFVTLDFGREVVGRARLTIRDGAYGVVDIGYSEALDAQGDVWPVRQSILQADRLILHGGRQEWETFGRRAFRYMQLTFRDLLTPVRLECVSLQQVGYPTKQVSSFECSDGLLNRIWRTGVDTLAVGMQDHFEDCPLREHGQYPGDARVQALLNYYSFGDYQLAAKALWQFVQYQREDGLFNGLWPSGTNHVLPDYCLVWVLMLHDYYLHTGDLSLVERLFPNLRLLLENWLRSQESADGLLTWEPKPDVPITEWWLFIDHAPVDKHGEVAAYNAFYYQALRDASKLANCVSSADEAGAWHARARRVLLAFNERFWSDDLGAYVDCNIDGNLSQTTSVQTNTLAVEFGLADAHKSNRIREFLASGSAKVKSAGPYFDFYVLQAMARLGMESEAFALLRRVWGGMLERGATNWWETFDPDWEEGVICPDSLCHAWSGAPTYFLPAEVLGVKPAGPTSAEVIVQPMPGDLDWAKGHVVTHFGCVDVEWHAELGRFTLDIDAPNGFIVALPISSFASPQIEEFDLTPETPERRARKTYGWGNVVWRDGEERDPYIDWLAIQQEPTPAGYVRKQRCEARERYIWVSKPVSHHVRYEIREGN